MAGRFGGRGRPKSTGESAAIEQGATGEWWAAIAVVALAALAIISLTGSREPVTSAHLPEPPPDRSASVLASISPAEQSLSAIEVAFAALCREPVLVALELEPDCETGVITLSDALFDGYGSAQLGAVAQEDLAAAMTTYLSQLRRMPALWESLESIELRGHTDPRAIRNPYATNMVGSQQRALGVLLFLVGPDGLGESDRSDLERLATVSGSSFSRPPASCPERSRECYAAWRRVEIRPVLSESLRRGDWSRTVQAVRNAATGPGSERDAQLR